MLLDSNLIIYASQPQHGALRRLIVREAPYVSVISKVETLGYHGLGENEQRVLEAFFDAAGTKAGSGANSILHSAPTTQRCVSSFRG
jgi:hypothetical protein